MAIVSLVIFAFLLHVRSALIPILTIPVGVLLAFVPMLYQGLTANIMSLGGIAVAIGAMVDASIIVVENCHKRLEEWEHEGRPGSREAVLLAAMQEVGPSLFFALLVITVSFLPIFALEATEGRLFKPLAFTKTYAMGFAAVLSVTLTPALAAIFLRGRIRSEEANPVNRALVRLYAPLVRRVVRHRALVVAGAAAADGGDGAGRPPARRRVHAAARRGHGALHADGAARHVDDAGRRRGAADEPRADGVPRGGARVREGRARRDAHRPGRPRDGRDRGDAEAEERMAPRHDAASAWCAR